MRFIYPSSQRLYLLYYLPNLKPKVLTVVLVTVVGSPVTVVVASKLSDCVDFLKLNKFLALKSNLFFVVVFMIIGFFKQLTMRQ
jgi:hypothetical protein